MTSRINTQTALSALAVLAALILCAAFAPAAGAEGPPPLPGADELPAAPADEGVPPTNDAPPVEEAPVGEGEGSVSDQVAVTPVAGPGTVKPRVLRARVSGKRLMVTLQCSQAGSVSLKGSGSRAFSCVSEKGSAALRLNRRQLKSANGSGLRAALVVRIAGQATSLPLTISPRSSAREATSSTGTWNYVTADCTVYSSRGGEGAFFNITTTTSNGFGAVAGETVYWATYMYEYRNGSWNRYAHDWESYRVASHSTGSSGTGYAIVGGGIGYGLGMSQGWNIPSGAWMISGVYTWSQRTGYQFNWVGNAQTFGYVQTSGPYCFAY